MSTIKATNITDLTGTYTSTTTAINRGIAKAWVNFDGTTASPSTIRASYNVSSITKNGTGDYTVNFTTALADGNYSFIVTAGMTASTVSPITGTVSFVAATALSRRFSLNQTTSGAATDMADVNVAIFR
jgi:hypothetical protein